MNLTGKLETIEATGPRWTLVVTDAKTEAHPPEVGTVPASYVDRNTGLRFWFLHGDTADDLADSQRAIDEYSRSGIPDVPGALITLHDENGAPVTGSLRDFLLMAELSWAQHVAQEMGLWSRAEQLEKELDAIANREETEVAT